MPIPKYNIKNLSWMLKRRRFKGLLQTGLREMQAEYLF
jgi:hypothetical protein